MRPRARILGALALAGALVAPCPAQPVVAAFERFHAGTDGTDHSAAGGLLLLNELNCVACHVPPDGWRERLPGRGKIRLAGVGARLSGQALAAFVASPGTVKPGTTMPALLHEDAAESSSIAAYVASLAAVEPKHDYPQGDAVRGRKLFGAVGCAACHAPLDGATTYASVPIGLASHAERSALAEFLQNPLHTRPAGRMPATELSDTEAADLAAYLAPEPKPVGMTSAAAKADAGRKAFVARNCAACHETDNDAPQRWARPLANARDDHGCLAGQPQPGVPWFELSVKQRSVLGAALQTLRANPSPPALTAEQRVTAKFEQLNCYACHEWRGRGGAEPARAAYFAATDAAESLGEIGHLPPRLDQAGRKLTPAWLEKLLWGSGGGVRPYMTARMPRFGEPAARELVPLLAEACRPETPQEIDVSGGKGHHRFAIGRTLLGTGTGGLGCVACHGLKNREPAGVQAINLTHTAKRLQPEYFKALLLDPQGVQPGTIMPPLLAGRPEAHKEIESMWTYFKELDQSEVLPEGLARAGSFELKPQEEGRPIVFRTFLEGAGTQAIAVGFPAGLHAAFDAFEVRWALVWRGRFLDAQSNWEERPMKPVKPLGEPTRMLPGHVSFAKTGDTVAGWPITFGAYAGYRFGGYSLDRDGVPTFRYSVDGLEVEDTVRPLADGTALRRTVTVRLVSGDAAGWYFRGASPDAAPEPLRWENGRAVIEETLLP